MDIRDTVEDPDAVPARMQWLNDRIGMLEGVGLTVGDARGLTDDLFLRNEPDAAPLQLQPNFAFWDFDYQPADVAQSEVLFAVTAIRSLTRFSGHGWCVDHAAGVAAV